MVAKSLRRESGARFWQIRNIRIEIPILGTIILNMGIKASTDISNEPGNKAGQGVSALADALFTTSQQRVLALLFGQPDREFFVTEIIGLVGTGRGAVQRELARLAGSGLASVSRIGNRKYYRANPESPLFEEISGIVRKTIGVEVSIRKALTPLQDRLVLAVLFGSVARGTDTATSDIDLLLVSDELTLETVYGTLAPAEELLGRRINPTLFTSDEFRRRREDGSGFVSQVLEKPHFILVDCLDDR